jgi:hypothetical protein
METQTGYVTVVQEGRFQLVGENGRTTLLILSHSAAIEPQDLPALQRSGMRVAVCSRSAPGKIARVAQVIRILEGPAPEASR